MEPQMYLPMWIGTVTLGNGAEVHVAVHDVQTAFLTF